MTFTPHFPLRLLCLLFCTLALPVSAQIVTEGTLAFGGGGTFLDGDLPAFQKTLGQKKDGFAGIENLTIGRLTDDYVVRFEARAIPASGDYRFAFLWEKADTFYLKASYQQFRIYYDGSGGRLLPRDLAISYFPEDLAVDRSYFSVELGNVVTDGVRWRLRYDHNTRSGSKNSLRWGDSNLGGPAFTVRAFIPSYLLLDEARDIVTAEASRRTETANWKAAGRYERSRVNNTHVARRRATEPQDRYLTMNEGTSTDLFSGHAHYERFFSKELRLSAGGLATTIDTNLSGSRIYGTKPRAAYLPVVAGGQANDAGYIDLGGNSQLKQYIGNVNLYYQVTKHLSVLPAVKFEHLGQQSDETHTVTSLSGNTAPATETLYAGTNRDSWDEVTEDLEVRYQRWPNLHLSARGQWNQGTGNLAEQSILRATGTTALDHNVDYQRYGQRYLTSATWYARPGLTFGAQYNYRLKLADYRAVRDSTPNTNVAASRDRYPQFIVDNDIASHDANLRMSWRRSTNLHFTTRYAYQQATVTTSFDNLGAIENGRLTRHVVTQAATWTPIPRLFVSGTVNVTYDQLWVPSHRLTVISDNNYSSASLSSGYALGKVTDLYLDLYHYRADNYTNNPEVTLPLNSGLTLNTAFLTWVRRQNERLIYTVKYGYGTNRDGSYGGQNNFTAHMLYGKVQVKF